MKTSSRWLHLVSGLCLLLIPYFSTFATDYYVDSIAGNDANTGITQAQAWKTIEKINNLNLEPGDTINLKAGSSYTVADFQTVLILQANDSGSTAQPVTIRSYGSGAKPLLYQSYSATRNSAVLGFYGGVSNVIIDGLHLKGVAGAHGVVSGRDGIDVFSTALLADGSYNSNVTIRNCEIEGGCRGLLLYNCINFTITNNYFHDINGANTNTRDWAPLWPEQHPGAPYFPLDPVANPVGADDDSGAEVIDLNSYCENIYIASNTVANCAFSSFDYGVDGAFIEVYGTHFKNIEICYNKVTNVPGGTVEMGSSAGGTMENFNFHHNLITETSCLYMIHTNGTYGLTDILNIRFNNNTFVQRSITDENFMPWSILSVNGTVTDATKLKVENNIFYLKTGTKNTWMGNPASSMSSIFGNDDTFTHRYNIYYQAPGAAGRFSFGTPADSTEKVGYDPLFANMAGANFTLGAGSPAIDAGISLGYSTDLAGAAIYSGAAPDMGAYESASGASAIQQVTIAGSTAGAEQAGNLKAQAYDGSVDTRWCNDGTLVNGWIQLDLGATYNVSTVKLMLENNHLLTYPIKIQVGDGTTFSDAFAGSTSLMGWKQFQDFTFPSKLGRYVRISLTGANSQGYYWFSLWETQIYRTTASSPTLQAITTSTAGSEQTGNTKGQAYDGSVDTRWCNDGTLANGWIQLDLGATYNVTSVKLMLENNHILTYPIKIQISDGTTFSDAFVGSTSLMGWKQYQDFTFPSKLGRYVKISSNGANSQGYYWFSLWEVQIYKAP